MDGVVLFVCCPVLKFLPQFFFRRFCVVVFVGHIVLGYGPNFDPQSQKFNKEYPSLVKFVDEICLLFSSYAG